MGFNEWRAERQEVCEAYGDWAARSVGLSEDEAYEDDDWLAAQERFEEAYDAVPCWRRVGLNQQMYRSADQGDGST